MTFFRSYFDESGKFKDHRVISFCGVMVANESLPRFNDAWNALLRKNCLTALHTQNALYAKRSLSSVIRGESAKARCESLKPFVDCIGEHLELGIALALDVSAFSKWSPGAKKRIGGHDDPAYLAFLRASLLLKENAGREDDRISIMCDDCEETAFNFYQLYRRFKNIDPVLRRKLVSISFADDKHYPALQAADLIASLVRLEALMRFGYHPYDFRPLFQHLASGGDQPRKLMWSYLFADAETLHSVGKQIERIPLSRD